MRTSTIIAAAGLAVATEAILLPRGAVGIKIEDVSPDGLPFEIADSAEEQAVKVDCPGCPIVVAGQPGLYRTMPGDSSHLDLDFRIDHAPAGDRLLLNGFELYPESDPLGPVSLRAAVRPDTHSLLPIRAQDLGFSLRVNPAVARTEDGANRLVAIDFQVIEIGNTFVQGLDSVHVKMLKNSDSGALMIAKIDKAASENPAPAANEPCKTLVCTLTTGINNIKSHMRPQGCSHPGHHGHGHGGNHAAHHGHPEGALDEPFTMGEGQIHHHPQRTWATLFKHFSYSVLMPILVGIVAGISVCLIGMIIGTVLVGLWRVVFRRQSFFPTRCYHRRRGASASRKAAESEAATYAEEKTGLMINSEDDTLPIYTDEDVKKDAA